MVVPARLPPSVTFAPSGPLQFRLEAFLPTLGAGFTEGPILLPEPDASVLIARVDVERITRPCWDRDHPPGTFVAEARDLADLQRIVWDLIAQAISGVVFAPAGTPEAVLTALQTHPRLVRVLPPIDSLGPEESVARAARALVLVLDARVVRMLSCRLKLRTRDACVTAALLDEDLTLSPVAQVASLDGSLYTAFRLARGCGWPVLEEDVARRRGVNRRKVLRWRHDHVPDVLRHAVELPDPPTPGPDEDRPHYLRRLQEDARLVEPILAGLARLTRAQIQAESYGPDVTLERLERGIVLEAIRRCGPCVDPVADWLDVGDRRARTLIDKWAPDARPVPARRLG